MKQKTLYRRAVGSCLVLFLMVCSQQSPASTNCPQNPTAEITDITCLYISDISRAVLDAQSVSGSLTITLNYAVPLLTKGTEGGHELLDNLRFLLLAFLPFEELDFSILERIKTESGNANWLDNTDKIGSVRWTVDEYTNLGIHGTFGLMVDENTVKPLDATGTGSEARAKVWELQIPPSTVQYLLYAKATKVNVSLSVQGRGLHRIDALTTTKHPTAVITQAEVEVEKAAAEKAAAEKAAAEKAAAEKAAAEKAAAEKAAAEKAAAKAATPTLNATRDSALHLSRSGIAALQQRLGQLRHQSPDHNRLRIYFADPRLQALARALPLQSDLAPAAMGPWQPWVAGQITVGEQDNTDLDITLNALHTGIDRSHDRYHYGFALGLQNQQSKGGGLKLKTQQTAIASYGAVQFGRWPQSLEGIIGMGNLSSDIDRATTQAKRAGKQTYASITYRLLFQHDQIQLSPYGRYDWHRTTLDAYEESGDADNALVLGYAAETINASFLAMGLGADFNRDQTLQPFLQLEYAADLTSYGDSDIYYLSNPDTRYTLAGRSDSPSQWSLDLGLRYHLPRLRLDFRYGRHQADDLALNSLAFSANWRF